MGSKVRRLVIAGCGRTGTSVGVLLARKGWKVAGVYDIDPARARKAASLIKKTTVLKDLSNIPNDPLVLLLTVPDDRIGECAQAVKNKACLTKGATVIHLSGAKGLKELQPLKKAGISLVALHPIQTFASVRQAIRSLPGSYFDATGSKAGLAVAAQIVRDLKGKMLVVKEEHRVFLHIASVISCNYLSVLMAAMGAAGKKAGMGQAAALKVQEPLILATLSNIYAKGPARALTGPIARGDTSTLEMHLKALKRSFKGLLPLYCELGREAVKLARQKLSISNYKARQITILLNKYSK